MGKWFLADLHMHSNFSQPYDHGRVKAMSAKDLLNTLISNEIELFSVTDHDCFSKSYFEEIQKEINDSNLEIHVIPGAELNVYVNGNNKFHANFYFSLDTDLDKLENAINELYKNNNKPFLNEIINKFYDNLFNFIIFPEAEKAAGIDKAIKKLRDDGLIFEMKQLQRMGMQRIFKAYDAREKFNETSANMWAETYYKNSEEFKKEFENRSDEEIERITNKIHNSLKGNTINSDDEDYIIVRKIKDIIEQYGSCFPYFHFTDWHNAETYTPKAKNYIYGDLNCPFESLELAVLDPLSRVKVYSLNSNKYKNNTPSNHIKSLSFIMDGKEQNINFSLGLNAIIGKRASGKSLLMSVLLTMLNKTDSELRKYDNFKIQNGSIKCEMFTGDILEPGNLSCITYIKQNEIKDIFDNPQATENLIRENFEEINEIDTSKYKEILKELKELNQFNINYKSFSEYIKNVNNFNFYSFKELNSINKDDMNESFKSILEEIDNLKSLMKNKGFINFKIDDIKRKLEKLLKIYDKKICLFNSLIDSINVKIKEKNKENASINENNTTIIENFNVAKGVIDSNLNTLFHFKKLQYLVNNFKLNIPNPKFKKKDKFLFETYYEVDDDYKESLIQLLEKPINKSKCKLEGFELLKFYLQNNTTLNKTFENLYENFEKSYLDKNISSKCVMYEIKEDIDLNNIKSNDDIKKLVIANKLEDISNSSLGRKSIAYLEYSINTKDGILLFDQPEDNIDNDYISNYFAPIIKKKKETNQLIFVTHNPSIAVYADAFNYIYANNDNGSIEYTNFSILKPEDKKEILKMLDGGTPSFANRNLKYGDIIGEFTYGD